MLVPQVWPPHPLPDNIFSNTFCVCVVPNFNLQGCCDIMLCFKVTCFPLFQNCFERWMIRWAQSVRTFAAKPDSLSSVPRTCMVEGKSESCSLSSDLHICAMAFVHLPTHAYTHTVNKCNYLKKKIFGCF